MLVIGFRVSTDSVAYCLLTGSKQKPTLISSDIIKLPKGYKRIESLKWLHNEISAICKKFEPALIAIKDTEVMARKGNSYVERLENETVVILAAITNGVKNFYKKVKATIAKDLTGTGKAKNLETSLDTSILPAFNKLSSNEKEAVIVAWSVLK